MAARGTRYRFYVYRLFDEDGQTLYIGKGSGYRLSAQKSNHQCYGEILEGHIREKDAYKRERHFIAAYSPPRNKHPGGNGGFASRRFPGRKPQWLREIEEVGSRRYAARMLLKFDLRGYLDPSKLEAIRQVANGPRC